MFGIPFPYTAVSAVDESTVRVVVGSDSIVTKKAEFDTLLIQRWTSNPEFVRKLTPQEVEQFIRLAVGANQDAAAGEMLSAVLRFWLVLPASSQVLSEALQRVGHCSQCRTLTEDPVCRICSSSRCHRAQARNAPPNLCRYPVFEERSCTRLP